MILLKMFIAFILLSGINYIVRVKNNSYYDETKDFIGSITNNINSKITNQ